MTDSPSDIVHVVERAMKKKCKACKGKGVADVRVRMAGLPPGEYGIKCSFCGGTGLEESVMARTQPALTPLKVRPK